MRSEEIKKFAREGTFWCGFLLGPVAFTFLVALLGAIPIVGLHLILDGE